MEGFREVGTDSKCASYVIWALAIVGFLFGIMQLVSVSNSLSQVTTDITVGRLTMDKVGLLLSMLSMKMSLAFGSIGLSGILIGIATFLYTRWSSVNLQARNEHLVRTATGVIVQEIRSGSSN
jgi:hypothetical protein